MADQRIKYQTQWAAQFYTAAELCRRGHLVALTMGNAPKTDLLVVSPGNVSYKVEVKGLSAPNFWLIQPCIPEDNLFFILVYVPKNLAAPKFFVISSHLLMDEMEKVLIEMRAAKSNMSGAGLRWNQALPYENRWELLPL